MADTQVNENIERNYLKVIKIEDRFIEPLREKFANSGEDLFEMILEQNQKVLVESSKVYNIFNDTKEKTQNELLKLDAVLDQVSELKAGNRYSGSPVEGGKFRHEDYISTTFGEFDKKLEELDKQIKTNNEKIEAEKKNLNVNADKIKDTKEYLQKFVLEKRLYLDKVSEESMREICYKDDFPHNYQAKVMKLIFESILLDKVTHDIKEESKKIKFDSNDPKYDSEYSKLSSQVTFRWYKKNCFNAWKFKNLVLAAEEYVIHEFQREKGELPTLEQSSLVLIKLKEEAEKIRDEYSEKIFWPLINAVLVTVYTSIAKRKLEVYEEQGKKIETYIKKLDSEKSECTGKISVLREVKTRINKSTVFSETGKNQAFEKAEERVEDEEETPDQGNFEQIKNQIIEDSNTIVENLKMIENEQESNFQDYLKKLGNVMINQKMLRNFSK